MTSFGNWLDEAKLNLTEMDTLRRSRNALRDQWPVKSNNIAEYASALHNITCDREKNASFVALYKLWPLYETQRSRSRSGVSATGWVVACVAGMLLLLIFWVLWKLNLTSLAGDDTRGLLAFLFGLTTVGIIIIVVVAVFFEAGETTLDDRFQRGKDILTILIGLLGAILGYYFGQANAHNGPNPPPGKVYSDGANTSGRAGSSEAPSK